MMGSVMTLINRHIAIAGYMMTTEEVEHQDKQDWHEDLLRSGHVSRRMGAKEAP